MLSLFRGYKEKPKVTAHFNNRAEAFAFIRSVHKKSGGANEALKKAVADMKKADKALAHEKATTD